MKRSFAVSVELAYVGTSSLNSLAKLYSPNTGEMFVYNVNQVVSISKATRKPVRLDGWWKGKYQGFAKESEQLVIPLVSFLEKTHIYEVKVPWMDIDSNKHANYISFF